MSSPNQRRTGTASTSTRPRLTGHGVKKKDPSPQCSTHKPLAGKSFYLDVRKHGARLKKDLEELGGVVETFLSKDISYVVSDRTEVKLECARTAVRGPQSQASPAVSTPSPFHQSRDSAHGAVDSPGSANAREGMVTRGKAIVRKATISQTYGTSNVLANARNWKVNIRYIDSVLKYVNKEKQKTKETGLSATSQKQNQQSKAVLSKERKLSRPSLKAEDISRQYRPSTKEMTVWPRVIYDGQAGSCPFETVTAPAEGQDARRGPDQQGRNNGESARAKAGQRTTMHGSRKPDPNVNTPGKQKHVAFKDSRRGYCECCQMKYTDLEKHLKEEQHRSFVRDSSHYASLDAMIDQGPNMEQFLEDVMHHHRWQSLQGLRNTDMDDDINLISSPPMLNDATPKHHQPSRDVQTVQGRRTTESAHVAGLRSTPTGKSHPHEANSVDDQITPTCISLTEKPCLVSQTSARERTPSAAREDLGTSGKQAAVSISLRPKRILDTQNNSEEATCIASGDCRIPGPRRSSCSRDQNQLSSPRRASGNLRRTQAKEVTRMAFGGCKSPGPRRSSCSRDRNQLSSPRRASGNLRRTQDKEATPTASGDCGSSRQRRSSRSHSQNQFSSPETPSGRRKRMQDKEDVPTASTECVSPSLRRSSRNLSPLSSPGTPRSKQVFFPIVTTRKELSQKGTSTNKISTPKDPSERRFTKLSLSARRSRASKEATTAEKVTLTVEKHPMVVTKSHRNDPQTRNLLGTENRNVCLSRTARKQLLRTSDNRLPLVEAANSKEPDPRSVTEVPPGDLGEAPQGDPGVANPRKGSLEVPMQGVVEATDDNAEKREQIPTKQKSGNRKRKLNASRESENGGAQGEMVHLDHQEQQGLPSKILKTCDGKDDPSTSHVREESSHHPRSPAQRGSKGNVDSVFVSDTNLIASSFLGFASDDITETEDCLQQLTASTSPLSNNLDKNQLQEAALDVCCIPSSELCLDGGAGEGSSDGSFEMGNIQDVVVGMALGNLANFPSDGSDWEAKVGGFMTGRLDEAVQIKKRELIQEKENQLLLKGSPGDGSRVPVAAQNLRLATKDEMKMRKKENRSKVVAVAATEMPKRALFTQNHESPRPERPTRSLSRTENSENQPRNFTSATPLQVISPNEKLRQPICSTPKRSTRRHSSRGGQGIVFSQDTSAEENYVHDANEGEGDHPKFSSPRRSSLASPVQWKSPSKSPKGKSDSKHCRSLCKLNSPQKQNESKRGLFSRRRNSNPVKQYHLLLNPPGSPRKRCTSPNPILPSSPLKKCPASLLQNLPPPPLPDADPPQPQVTYIPANERSKVSPTFYSNTKPNFSSHLLKPESKKRRSDRLRSKPQTPALRRSARTRSLCSSYNEGVYRSEDVYEFMEELRNTKAAGSSNPGNDRGSQPTNAEPRSGANDEKSGGPRRRPPGTVKTESASRDQAESSKKKPSPNSDLLEEFGLPYSFFM